MLDTLEATVSLNRATASELDSMAMVSHLRTVISLEAAFKEEKIVFIGQRTQELFGAAKEAHRLAGVSENLTGSAGRVPKAADRARIGGHHYQHSSSQRNLTLSRHAKGITTNGKSDP